MRKLKWLFMVCVMTMLVSFCMTDVSALADGVDFDSGDGFLYVTNDDGTLTITSYYLNEETIVFPSEINGQQVKTICLKCDYYSAWDRWFVKHIIIPEGITNINVHPDNSSDQGSFTNCGNLQTVSLPSTLKSIGPYTFTHCLNLKSIVLPDGLTEIGTGAFRNCDSLKKLTIPDSVVKIGNDIFWPNITLINAKPGSYAKTYANKNDLPFSCMEHTAIIIDPEIPATCTKEGLTAGSHCSDCNNIITKGEAVPAKGHTIVPESEIPATCQHSGGVKGHCSVCGEDTGWIHWVSITKHKIITIYTPPTCTQFGKTETYCEMCGERNIDADGANIELQQYPPLPHQYDNGVIDVNSQSKVFTCTACGAKKYTPIETVTPPSTPKDNIVSNLPEDYQLTKTGSNIATVTYTGKKNYNKSILIIPDTITVDGISYKVTSIASNALKNNKKITKVVIGKNVTAIGTRAFSGCTKLKNVTIGKNVKIIYNEAFKGCRNLKNITIQSNKLVKIGNNIFKGIHPKAKIKVPAKKLKKYQGKLKKKGQKPTVKIIA